MKLKTKKVLNLHTPKHVSVSYNRKLLQLLNQTFSIRGAKIAVLLYVAVVAFALTGFGHPHLMSRPACSICTCEWMSGLVWKSCVIWKRRGWQGTILLWQVVWLVRLQAYSLICTARKIEEKHRDWIKQRSLMLFGPHLCVWTAFRVLTSTMGISSGPGPGWLGPLARLRLGCSGHMFCRRWLCIFFLCFLVGKCTVVIFATYFTTFAKGSNCF